MPAAAARRVDKVKTRFFSTRERESIVFPLNCVACALSVVDLDLWRAAEAKHTQTAAACFINFPFFFLHLKYNFTLDAKMFDFSSTSSIVMHPVWWSERESPLDKVKESNRSMHNRAEWRIYIYGRNGNWQLVVGLHCSSSLRNESWKCFRLHSWTSGFFLLVHDISRAPV